MTDAPPCLFSVFVIMVESVSTAALAKVSTHSLKVFSENSSPQILFDELAFLLEFLKSRYLQSLCANVAVWVSMPMVPLLAIC
jgi:hypothetical protein